MSRQARRSAVAWVWAVIFVAYANVALSESATPPASGNPLVDLFAWAWDKGASFLLAFLLGALALEMRKLYMADRAADRDKIRYLENELTAARKEVVALERTNQRVMAQLATAFDAARAAGKADFSATQPVRVRAEDVEP